MDTTPIAKDVTEATFAQEVVERSRTRPVVVDFWAPWCGPCHQLSPIIERVAARYAEDADLVKVNVDEAQGIARQYRVQGIPSVKAFKDGVVTSEFTGVQPEQAVEAFFASLVPSEADRLVATAADATDPEGLLRQALEHDPGHAGAIVALGRILVDRGDHEETRSLLGRIPGDADARRLLAEVNLAGAAIDDVEGLQAKAERGDAVAQLQLGQHLAATGDHEAALPWLVAAVGDPSTRQDARERTLEVFSILGDDHELVRLWRPKLAAALF